MPPTAANGLSAPDTKAGRLQRALLKLIDGPKHRKAKPQALPTSNRFLFYELVQMGIVRKDDGTQRPDNPVIAALTTLRKLTLVPWPWIVDETRSLTEWAYSATIEKAVLRSLNRARLDCWRGAPPPMILTESRSLAGVLEHIASEFLCPIASTNGQVAGFLHNEVAPALQPGQEVLTFGDLDDPGKDIEANTRTVLEAIVGPLTWTRLALTEEQVRRYRVPTKWKIDGRKKDGKRRPAYECEALSQVVIQNLLRRALIARLPEPSSVVHAREDRQRARIRRLLTRERR